MLLKHLFQGGIIFMLPIYILWVLTLFFILRVIVKRLGNKGNYEEIRTQNRKIILFGSLAFLHGLVGQIIALLDAFKVLEKMEKVSVDFLLEGIWISFLAPIYGLILFLVSLVFHLILLKHSKNHGSRFRDLNHVKFAFQL